MLSTTNGGGHSMWMMAGALVASVLLGGTIGCASKEQRAKKQESYQPDFFGPETQQRSADRFIEVQAAEGAKEDAMLFAAHFEGDELNTAGQVKLSLMLRNQSPRQPLIVYMTLPANDPLAPGRRSAVEQYVKSSGIAIARLELRDGDNPLVRTNASRNLANLPKTDSGPRPGGAAAGDAATGAGAPTGMGTGSGVDMSPIAPTR